MMNAATPAAPRRAGLHRPGLRRARLLVLAGLAGGTLVLTGCSTGSGGDSPAGGHTADQAAADTVRALGKVPIPSPPTAAPTPVAGEHHLQLVAMGYPVRADLPGADAVVVAGGPTEEPLPNAGKVPDRAVATFTITVTGATGPLTITAKDFTSRDERGTAVVLEPDGPATATARPGHPAKLLVTGTYHAGAAQLTWRHDDRVVALWDFNIELD